MKLSCIAMAMAATCGALASVSSFAITANNYTNTGEFTGDTLNIRISGATAQDAGILGSALSLCQAGTVHRYAISNNFVFYCTPDGGTNPGQIAIPARSASSGGPITKLAIYKYSVGGSAFGVSPLNSTVAADGSTGGNGAQLPFLNLNSINSNCTGTFAVTTTLTFGPGTNGSYVNVSCGNSSSALTSAAVTYVGVSDMEPAFFSNATSNLTTTSATALIFAPVVTKNVYDRLQQLQGLSLSTTPACGATLDSEGCMPSLSSSQLVTLYTQPGQAWSSLGVTGLTADNVYIARRVDSSGTQKTFEALIAGSPNGNAAAKSCSIGTNAFALPDSAGFTPPLNVGLTTGDNESVCAGLALPTTFSGPTVFSGSGGSNLRNCLTNHQAGGRGAIGILTTEDKPNGSWRFVKVDGVTPNQAQTAAGRYRFYTETAINTRTAGAFNTAGAEGYSAFVSRFITDFGNATIVKQINGADQTFGAAGLMALLSRQASGTAPDFTGAATIVPWTKVGGAGVDNCQRPSLFN